MHEAAVWCATALALLGHALAWTEAVSRLHGLRGPRPAIKGLTVLCVAVFAALPAAAAWKLWLATDRAANLFAIPGFAAAYAWACAAIGALGLVVKPWVEHRRYDRRTLAKWTAEPRDVARAIGASPFVGAWARLLGGLPGNEAATLSIDRKQLAVPGLPPALVGLTIAHISDLHMTGQLRREFYAYVVRAVNDLRPDVIAITGDVVEVEACQAWLVETLGGLCAPLGVYAILGNHDLFIDADRTRALLTEAGLADLGGRWIRADWNGVPVVLGGNEAPWGPAPSPAEAPPRAARRDDFRLVLCHTPDQWGWSRRAGAHLCLAGHTHGGQVQLPWLGVVLSPSLHGARYACGVFRHGDAVLHVTRGLAGQTPLRWRCPPEIALLELVAAPAGDAA